MTASRQQIRAQLAALLSGALSGSGGAAQVVYDHLPGDFDGQSPVVAVGSRGSTRERLTFRGGQTTFLFDVFVFVLAADAAAGWTEADAEDAIDTIELAIAEALGGNQTPAVGWTAADYAGETEVDYLTIGGAEYRRERIPIALTVPS